jgi:hypothetical protein
MNKTDIERERRLQRRLEALGTNNPRCIHCGEDDPFCLEVHELGGREFSDHSTIECRNCHRKLEDRRKDHPQQLSPSPSTDESLAHILYGIADALKLLAEFICKCADRLLERICQDTAINQGGVR